MPTYSTVTGFPDDLCDMTENPLLKVWSLSEIPSRGFSDVWYVSSHVCLCQYAAVERLRYPTASFLVQDGICVGRVSVMACMTSEKVTALQCITDGEQPEGQKAPTVLELTRDFFLLDGIGNDVQY